MAEPQGADSMAGGGAGLVKLRYLTLALTVDAFAVPLMVLWVAVAPGEPVPPLLLALWLAMGILGPCAAVIAKVWHNRGARTLHLAGEARESLLRLFLTGLVLAYLAALSAWGLEGARLLPLPALVVSANLYAWLLLIDAMLRPALRRWRAWAALAVDIAFLSLFLHVGRALAAPWFSLYVAVILGFGARFGWRALAGADLLGLAGFAAVYAGTLYWQAHPELAGGVVLALILLPACAATLVSPLAAVTAPAGAAGSAKTRFLAPISHEWHARLDGALAAALGEAAEAPKPAPRAAPPLPAPARPLKILVAESSGANRKILRRLLETAGHRTAMVEDGEAALAALDGNRFDLALIDVNLPRRGGCDVSKLYRMEHLGESRLPIIALAADPGIETERLCREAGMDAVLGKPIETAQLLAAIDETHARVTGGADAARAPVVTPISAHPRYFADAGAVVDEATIEALRLLGGSSDFLGDVIDTFCSDARRLLEQLRQAAAEGDLPAFKELVHSLRSGAANVGAARLCQILAELRDITARDLRLDGGSYIEKLVGEFAKLDTALGRIARESRIA